MMGIIERICVHASKRYSTPCCNVLNYNFFQTCAFSECTIFNARHAVGDGDGGKARAIRERTFSNARHTVADGDGGKARAFRERIISNACHTIGDGYGGEARTTRERRKSNARHTVADGDGGKARAMIVFVYCFISIIYVLNGRKVTRRILSRLVKMKI